jgi:imidazoleglycerol-phosphate dehydratase
MRNSEYLRSTTETEVKVQLNIDGTGKADINTGIGFLDHMLTHLSIHGCFDISLEAQGDLQVDPHHTIEDCAISLGKCFNLALGERRGIARMGHALVTMDDALVMVAIDLSGRPYWVIDIPWVSDQVASLPVSLFDHFFESFSAALLCNLHIKAFYGRDNHHLAEAAFKALGRALDLASMHDARRQGNIPSTKGTLT